MFHFKDQINYKVHEDWCALNTLNVKIRLEVRIFTCMFQLFKDCSIIWGFFALYLFIKYLHLSLCPRYESPHTQLMHENLDSVLVTGGQTYPVAPLSPVHKLSLGWGVVQFWLVAPVRGEGTLYVVHAVQGGFRQWVVKRLTGQRPWGC